MFSRGKEPFGSSSGKKVRIILTIVFVLFLIATVIISFPRKTVVNVGRHSSELEKTVSAEGSTERTEYYYRGVLTYAADKHYATLIKTTNGNTVLEEYFDENGDPVRQSNGHYALLREYDEQGYDYKVTYLDENGAPTLNKSGYCTVIHTYNESGLVEYDHYFDIQNDPVMTSSGVYGRYSGYENGRNTVLIYLDQDDKPTRHESGYSIIRRVYYEEGPDAGRVKYEFYFDENDSPISLSNHQYGVYKEYDDLGRAILLTYLGKDGEPIRTSHGYTTVRRTFKPSNSVLTEMYFDLDGSPVALNRGQYGVKHENNKTIYLDRNGREIFDLVNYLNNNPISVLVFGLITMGASMLLGKKGNVGLLCLYLLFIAYMTLMSRWEDDARAQLRLFWSYKQFFSSSALRLEILKNIWLFIPLGIILYHLSDRKWILLAPVAVSLAIEIIQYFTGRGLAEFDDIVSNELGALIGFAMGYTLDPIRRRFKQVL